MIVVDDGSTEPLPELPPEVELIRQENQRVARARNAGLARVETPYVLVLDADDRLAPGALAALREPLEADPSLGFTYGRMRFFGAWEGEMAFPPYRPLRAPLPAHDRAERARAARGLRADGRLRPDASSSSRTGSSGSMPSPKAGTGGRSTRSRSSTEGTRPRSTGATAARTARRFRKLRAKHAELYRTAARDPARAVWAAPGTAWFWGYRPVPAVVELALHRLRWGVKETR